MIVNKKKGKLNQSQQRKKQDDPYYCGLLARIPNFIKTNKSNQKPNKSKESKIARKISASQQPIFEAEPVPIATFHQFPAHIYYPYKLYPQYAQQPRLSQSQLSLWDARSLISAHGK